MKQEGSLSLFMQSLQTLDPTIGDQQLQQFLRYQRELIEWNVRFNLTAITDPAEILFKHFLDLGVYSGGL